MRTIPGFVDVSKILAIGAIAGLALTAGFASAQSDATSTDPIIEETAETIATDASSTETISADATPAPEPALTAPAPLKAARIVRTKYVDYCTDGKETIAMPGDPEVDANLNKPDAPTPKCPEGMTWDHTSGMDEYDTETGGLEIGAYAKQADGTYIVHLARQTYVDATSTSEWPDRYVIMTDDPAGSIENSPEFRGGVTSTTTENADIATTSPEEPAPTQAN